MTAARPGARAGIAPLAAATALILILSGCGAIPALNAPVTPVVERPFTQPLAIPPLAESHEEGGARVFSLTTQEGSRSFAPATQDGIATPTWGFNGGFLGPTLRAKRGERVAIEVDNKLSEPTSVHWHGMHLPAAMDGGPHQEIPAGGSWRPEWTIDQPAATLWYHPHPHGATEEHVHRGLAGMFIVDDDASLGADLPGDYGVDDIPVIVQDRSFDRDGRFVLEHDGAEPGELGNAILVNGTVGPYFEVTSERIRLRILNGSTARSYQFTVPGQEMTMVASDGGLFEAPILVDELRLAPAERAEIVLTLEPGDTARLHSAAVDLGGVAVPSVMGGGDGFDVLELRVADRIEPSPEPSWPISKYAAEDALREADTVRTREFLLEGREINGKRMDMDRIDEVVRLGDTEVWEVRSAEPVPHSFHIHDVQFRILTIDGEAPPAELAGRKDTIYLEPRRNYRLLMRFDDYADPHHAYMFHCHMLLHEDEGMMGQFVVIEPDEPEPDSLGGETSGSHAMAHTMG